MADGARRREGHAEAGAVRGGVAHRQAGHDYRDARRVHGAAQVGEGRDPLSEFPVPTNFKEDVWVQAAEARPGNAKVSITSLSTGVSREAEASGLMASDAASSCRMRRATCRRSFRGVGQEDSEGSGTGLSDALHAGRHARKGSLVGRPDLQQEAAAIRSADTLHRTTAPDHPLGG